jgi:hypothetical protein
MREPESGVGVEIYHILPFQALDISILINNKVKVAKIKSGLFISQKINIVWF